MCADQTCELGPIRPPSEATSLLLRVTRNCPYNRCAFCPVYKNTRFSRRKEHEIMADIDTLAHTADRVRECAGAANGAADLPARATSQIVRDPLSSDLERRLALWLHLGGKNVFLQDADSLIVPAHRVSRVLRHLKRRLPSIERITTYARSRTLAAKSLAQLKQLRADGLTRIHVGLESGADEVLALIRKGCRAEHHLTGIGRALDAGFEVCCYVMPGLGGRRLSEIHASGTAAVLKSLAPHHIRLRTLWVDPGSTLAAMTERGEFVPLEEDETVSEIAAMLAPLYGLDTRLVSDHDRNLLPELQGHLRDDAEDIRTTLNTFLNLPADQKNGFIVARRKGYFRTLKYYLDDLESQARFTAEAAALKTLGRGSLVSAMMSQMGNRSL